MYFSAFSFVVGVILIFRVRRFMTSGRKENYPNMMQLVLAIVVEGGALATLLYRLLLVTGNMVETAFYIVAMIGWMMQLMHTLTRHLIVVHE